MGQCEHDGLGRRAFLGAGLAGVALLPGLRGADAGRKPQLITRQKEPVNLEFPFTSLDSFLTPNDLFYVRCHYAIPHLDAKSWRLQLAGAVDRPLTLTLAELRALPARTQTVTLECAGNGRGFLRPRAKGVLWELGAVSTAEWTGAPLAAVLEKAGVKTGAVDVILEGADRGDPKKALQPPGGPHPF